MRLAEHRLQGFESVAELVEVGLGRQAEDVERGIKAHIGDKAGVVEKESMRYGDYTETFWANDFPDFTIADFSLR